MYSRGEVVPEGFSGTQGLLYCCSPSAGPAEKGLETPAFLMFSKPPPLPSIYEVWAIPTPYALYFCELRP